MTTEQQLNKRNYIFPLEELRSIAPDIHWNDPPVISPHFLPTIMCQLLTDWYVTCSDEARRHDWGQFFTPISVARYMAKAAYPLPEKVRLLEPGAGIGMLISAICESALQQHVTEVAIDAYEVDPILCHLCTFVLEYARDFLNAYNISLSFTVHQQDFLIAMAEQRQTTSLWSEWSEGTGERPSYDLVILNPPYFKLNQQDIRTKLVKDIAEGRTNMYTMFMFLAASSLRPNGHYISITPRSFASGAYFKHFRRHFFHMIQPEHIHLFDSRRSIFEEDEVLQENIIFIGRKEDGTQLKAHPVTISRSRGMDDIQTPLSHTIERHLIIDESEQDTLLHLPSSDLEIHLLQTFKRWSSTIATCGLEISTGPVVPFRATHALTTVEQAQQSNIVPLLWLQHVRQMQITWPLPKFHKPQALLLQADPKLLVKNTTQIIIRRFSTKEEPRRITAAVLQERMFGTDFIGIENHLNYLYRPGGTLSLAEATGLAAFLNSNLVDRYFRITNGNTQVNATELRNLPLPAWECVVRIGEQIIRMQSEQDVVKTEHILMDQLKDYLAIDDGEDDIQIPIIIDSRIQMGKIQEAQQSLKELGLPSAQQNEISALTLLALCSLDEATAWTRISQNTLTIHEMMGFMKSHYGRIYAENTRETVRRQVIHQFEQAALIVRNPDDADRPTNSPNTCYALSDEAYEMLRQYNTSNWDDALADFHAQHGTLQTKYQRIRQSVTLPLILGDGTELTLTPGKHNELQIAIVKVFGPRYVPGALLLYLGDTAKKHIVYDKDKLEQLHIPITNHDKLPDVVLFDEPNNHLFLIEAVTSHGPVSHKRLYELEKLLEHCTAQRAYISAFLTYNDYRKYGQQIAWDTDIWIAEIPEHLIHHNGDKFISLHGRI